MAGVHSLGCTLWSWRGLDFGCVADFVADSGIARLRPDDDDCHAADFSC